MTETEWQQFIGRMIMQILDLYSEGKVPLPPADVPPPVRVMFIDRDTVRVYGATHFFSLKDHIIYTVESDL